jgi:hypothetical protein
MYVEKAAQKLDFSIAQSRQSPNRRKFALSGHSDLLRSIAQSRQSPNRRKFALSGHSDLLRFSLSARSTQNQFLVHVSVCPTGKSRVTRLGEFSTVGRFFTLRSSLKITEVDHIFGYFVPRLRLCNNLYKSGLGYNFGHFFDKLIRSPG